MLLWASRPLGWWRCAAPAHCTIRRFICPNLGHALRAPVVQRCTRVRGQIPKAANHRMAPETPGDLNCRGDGGDELGGLPETLATAPTPSSCCSESRSTSVQAWAVARWLWRRRAKERKRIAPCFSRPDPEPMPADTENSG